MPTIKFTAKEAEAIDARLSAPDLIAEALTDVFPGDPAPPYSYRDALKTAEWLLGELQSSQTLTFNNRLERDVITDAVDGSCLPDWIADAVIDDDMTRSEAAAWKRAMKGVCRKCALHGINVAFR